jgi:hypothetical protein
LLNFFSNKDPKLAPRIAKCKLGFDIAVASNNKIPGASDPDEGGWEGGREEEEEEEERLTWHHWAPQRDFQVSAIWGLARSNATHRMVAAPATQLEKVRIFQAIQAP